MCVEMGCSGGDRTSSHLRLRAVDGRLVGWSYILRWWTKSYNGKMHIPCKMIVTTSSFSWVVSLRRFFFRKTCCG